MPPQDISARTAKRFQETQRDTAKRILSHGTRFTLVCRTCKTSKKVQYPHEEEAFFMEHPGHLTSIAWG